MCSRCTGRKAFPGRDRGGNGGFAQQPVGMKNPTFPPGKAGRLVLHSLAFFRKRRLLVKPGLRSTIGRDRNRPLAAGNTPNRGCQIAPRATQARSIARRTDRVDRRMICLSFLLFRRIGHGWGVTDHGTRHSIVSPPQRQITGDLWR